ncbi:hypothetical protein ANCCAN_11755 [Ancylostoma caninum]|uniref:Uncharacterized protein n=1 Tax=Ancylostoma caninum TaxID=29170 RepID=A0A368GGU9_ANCCA|nr:hypothetical protein ANCCAN_11755 [Ancylostoma caninum]
MSEAVVESLIGCCLDGLLLGAPELELTKDEFIENPTKTDIRKYQFRGGQLAPRPKTRIAREEDQEAGVTNATMEGNN